MSWIKEVPANSLTDERIQFIGRYVNVVPAWHGCLTSQYSNVMEIVGIPIGAGCAYLVTALIFTSVNPLAGVALYLGYEGTCKVIKFFVKFLADDSLHALHVNSKLAVFRNVVALLVGQKIVTHLAKFSSIGFLNAAGILLCTEWMKFGTILLILHIASRVLIKAQREPEVPRQAPPQQDPLLPVRQPPAQQDPLPPVREPLAFISDRSRRLAEMRGNRVEVAG